MKGVLVGALILLTLAVVASPSFQKAMDALVHWLWSRKNRKDTR